MKTVKLELTVFEALALLTILTELPKVSVPGLEEFIDKTKDNISNQLERIYEGTPISTISNE